MTGGEIVRLCVGLRRTAVERPVSVVADQDDFLVLLHAVGSFNVVAALPSHD